MLTNILNTLHITKRDFYKLNCLHSDQYLVNVVWFWFSKCFVPLTCRLLKGPMKEDFLEIWLRPFFGVPNFGNTWGMRVILFWKCTMFKLHFKSAVSNWENVLSFWDYCIWIGCLILSLLTREYLLLAVNILKNIFKTFHVTKRDLFQLNCFGSHE